MAEHIMLGEIGEAAATEYLRDAGFEVLDRNWRCQYGEVDIVAREGCELVFVEVKTRRSIGYGHPLEAITPRKFARMRRVVYAWRLEHPSFAHGSTRFDAVSIILPRSGVPSIVHIEAIEL